MGVLSKFFQVNSGNIPNDITGALLQYLFWTNISIASKHFLNIVTVFPQGK